MILADKIIEERKKNGWSQEELAEQLGVSRQAVSKWESAGAIPDLQRVIQLANVFGVSTDYLLKDDMLPENNARILTPVQEHDSPLHKVTMTEAQEYLTMKAHSATAIGYGVMLCILSPILLIILAGLAESSLLGITENIATAIGVAVLLSLIASAVFLFITSSIRENHFEILEKEPFETEYGVTGMVKDKRSAHEGTFTRGIAIGVVLCIIAVVPLIVAGAMEAPDFVCEILCGVLLALVAIGVNMIVQVCIVRSGFNTLLQEGDYSKKEKKINRKLEAVNGIYWSIATAIYLGWSFWTMRWEFTWIVWPVAGVLFAAVTGFVRLHLDSES